MRDQNTYWSMISLHITTARQQSAAWVTITHLFEELFPDADSGRADRMEEADSREGGRASWELGVWLGGRSGYTGIGSQIDSGGAGPGRELVEIARRSR